MSELIRKQIAEARELRAKATQLKWELTLEQPDGFPAMFLDADKTVDFTYQDMNFMDHAANNWNRLLKQLEIATTALEIVKLGCPTRVASCTCVRDTAILAIKEMESAK